MWCGSVARVAHVAGVVSLLVRRCKIFSVRAPLRGPGAGDVSYWGQHWLWQRLRGDDRLHTTQSLPDQQISWAWENGLDDEKRSRLWRLLDFKLTLKANQNTSEYVCSARCTVWSSSERICPLHQRGSAPYILVRPPIRRKWYARPTFPLRSAKKSGMRPVRPLHRNAVSSQQDRTIDTDCVL